ncbi:MULTISPECIES: hypothetical protein [Halorussus]|uniref:hypothetical protein n=1 Tax=Halorussus TaxID=1070314 RepID=UPI00209E17C2|nr:hypothetical protein [Halorussus vallis]USZ75959.1 hypothetical protein NGM07_01230 [Halorussus vallis]
MSHEMLAISMQSFAILLALVGTLSEIAWMSGLVWVGLFFGVFGFLWAVGAHLDSA